MIEMKKMWQQAMLAKKQMSRLIYSNRTIWIPLLWTVYIVFVAFKAACIGTKGQNTF